MSVIVKGLDLPAYKEGYKNRYVCLLVQNSDGTTDLYVADKKYPVSTVPTPHGRLIDAEERNFANRENIYQHSRYNHRTGGERVMPEKAKIFFIGKKTPEVNLRGGCGSITD